MIAEHPSADLMIDPSYLSIKLGRDAIIEQLILNDGRTGEQEKAFFKAVFDGLNAWIGMLREDLVVSLVETKKENWSFSNGEAQYAGETNRSRPRTANLDPSPIDRWLRWK